MAEWKGQSRGTVLGYKIFLFLLERVGVRAAYILLVFVSSYYFFFVPKATKSIYLYMRKIGYNPLRAIIKTRLNLFVFGQTIIDKFAIMGGLKHAYSYEFDGEENLVEMGKTTGGILIGAHLGNWDIAGNFLNKLDTPFNVVMYENEVAQMKKFMDKNMNQKKINIIAIKDDLSHIFQINNAIRNKELICFHGDRYMDGTKPLKAKFFGEEAYFPHGPFYMANKFKYPYSFVYCMKEAGLHYHLYASPGKVHEGTIDELLAIYVKQLEEKVKKYPLQWFNYYDFWKKPSSTKPLA